MKLTGDALLIWNELILPLIVLALVVTAIVAIVLHIRKRAPGQQDVAHAARCASCAAGVYHSQHPKSEGN